MTAKPIEELNLFTDGYYFCPVKYADSSYRTSNFIEEEEAKGKGGFASSYTSCLPILSNDSTLL